MFDKILHLAKSQNLSINQVEEKLGYSKNTLYRLKRTNPSGRIIIELADFFDVSADYLLGRDEFINKQNTYISGDNNGIAGVGGSVTINNNAPDVPSTNNNIDDSIYLQEETICLQESNEIVQAKMLQLLEKHTELFEAILEEIKKQPRN